MTTGETLFTYAMAVGGILGCGLFAGLETGIYSLNRVRLHILEHQNNTSAKIIARLMSKQGSLLAALLIATNIATNIATSSMGSILEGAGCTHLQMILYDVLILTPLLFVFAETLPKDLFSVHADRFVYPFARFLLVVKWLLMISGILPLVTLMGTLTMKLLGGSARQVVFHPRMQVATLVREGVGYGLLSDEQSALTGRVLRLAQRTLDDEMTPWDEVVKLKINDTTDTLWSHASRSSISRYPVVNEQGDVLGMISLHEALMYDRANCPPIRELLQSLPDMDVSLPVRAALRQLQDTRTAMGIIRDNGKPVGIVTVKDLVEPITGELTSW
jgi:CBS domain containing-hemolysin-like protein